MHKPIFWHHQIILWDTRDTQEQWFWDTHQCKDSSWRAKQEHPPCRRKTFAADPRSKKRSGLRKTFGGEGRNFGANLKNETPRNFPLPKYPPVIPSDPKLNPWPTFLAWGKPNLTKRPFTGPPQTPRRKNNSVQTQPDPNPTHDHAGGGGWTFRAWGPCQQAREGVEGVLGRPGLEQAGQVVKKGGPPLHFRDGVLGSDERWDGQETNGMPHGISSAHAGPSAEGPTNRPHPQCTNMPRAINPNSRPNTV